MLLANWSDEVNFRLSRQRMGGHRNEDCENWIAKPGDSIFIQVRTKNLKAQVEKITTLKAWKSSVKFIHTSRLLSIMGRNPYDLIKKPTNKPRWESRDPLQFLSCITALSFERKIVVVVDIFRATSPWLLSFTNGIQKSNFADLKECRQMVWQAIWCGEAENGLDRRRL